MSLSLSTLCFRFRAFCISAASCTPERARKFRLPSCVRQRLNAGLLVIIPGKRAVIAGIEAAVIKILPALRQMSGAESKHPSFSALAEKIIHRRRADLRIRKKRAGGIHQFFLQLSPVPCSNCNESEVLSVKGRHRPSFSPGIPRGVIPVIILKIRCHLGEPAHLVKLNEPRVLPP